MKFNSKVKISVCLLVLSQFLTTFPRQTNSNYHSFLNLHTQPNISKVSTLFRHTYPEGANQPSASNKNLLLLMTAPTTALEEYLFQISTLGQATRRICGQRSFDCAQDEYQKTVFSFATAAKTVANLNDRSELLDMLEVAEPPKENSESRFSVQTPDPVYQSLEPFTPEARQVRLEYVSTMRATLELLAQNPQTGLELRELLQMDQIKHLRNEGFAFHWDAAFDHGFLAVAAALAREGAIVGVVYATRAELRLVEEINGELPSIHQIYTAKTPEKLSMLLEKAGAGSATLFTTREITGALMRPFYNDVIILGKDAVRKARPSTSKLLETLQTAIQSSRYISRMP